MASYKKIDVPLTDMELHSLRLLLIGATTQDPQDDFLQTLLAKISNYRKALHDVPTHVYPIRQEMDSE